MFTSENILGKTFTCECGSVHSIPTEYFIIIPETNNKKPVCDDLTFKILNKSLKQADVFLAVGSGVVNDLTKWLAFERKVPYAVVATAASMNGYTAANVAPTIKGVKSLIRARAPFAVFANPEVIISAPGEMTASGLGDLIAKPMSTTDWVMNNKFFGEHFCEKSASLINEIEPLYFNNPEKVKSCELEAVEALVTGLMYTGFAMTMIGVSSPASGGEHLFSHTLDMMSSVDGVSHDLHGRQVGIGTIISAALYERILSIEKPEIHELQVMRDKLSSKTFWTELKILLKKRVRPAKQIADCLGKAGAARKFSDINCSSKRAMTALLHAHEIRKRPTVIDLAWTLGILPSSAEEIFKEYSFGREGF